MAQKFIKKWFEPGEIDGEIVKIKEGQSLKAMEGSSEVDLIKIESGKVMLKGAEAALQSDISALESDIESALSDAKSYADGKISDLVNGAPIALDTLKELADKLSEEESALNALITQVDENLQDAKDYSDEKLAAHLNDAEGAHAASAISFDNSGTDIVATNLQTALVEFGTVLTEEIEAEVSRAEGAESGLQSQITQEIADRQSADAAKLLEAKSYTDSKIAAIPSVDLSPYETVANVDIKDAGKLLEAKLYSDSLMSAEVDARNAAISVAVIAEREARELFDGMFDANLNQEILDRQAADEQLSEQITSTASSLMGTIGAVYTDLMGEVSAREAGDSATLDASKAYTDTKIAEIPSTDLSGFYTKSEIDSKESSLDSKISTEKGRVDAILLASDADKDTFAEIVQLINQVDTTSDEVFAGYVLANNAAVEALDGRLDVAEPKISTLESKVSTLESEMDQAQSDLGSLDGRLDVAEPKISTLESSMSTAQSNISTLQSSMSSAESNISTLQGKVSTLESKMSTAESDISAAKSDISALETQVASIMGVVDPVVKEDEEIVPSVLTHVDLENEALKIYKLCVGRVQVFKGVDYSVSVVGGKTRITWIGDMASGGSHAIALSDKVYCTYLFNVASSGTDGSGGGGGGSGENTSTFSWNTSGKTGGGGVTLGSDGQIVKSSGGASYNVNVLSTEQISDGQSFEFTLDERFHNVILGVATEADPSGSYSKFQFAVYNSIGWYEAVLPNGYLAGSFNAGFTSGDVIKYQLSGSNLIFSVNGVVKHTQALSSNAPLYASVCIYSETYGVHQSRKV
jgi:predicted  nucleic acid-binding Zn-ribbon protein